MARYTTDEVMAMMQSPQPEVEVLERPASPFLDPAQINAAERELSQPAPEVPRPDSINAPGANLLLQNYTAEEAFPVDSTPAPQRPADGNATLYPSRNETSPNLPKPRYSTDEVISLYANESKPRLSTKQVMVEMIKPLYDPTLPRPSKEEFFKLRDIEKQLRDSGDIPSNFEETANAVGGFFVTAVDALNTALWKVDREQGLFEFGGMGVNPALAVSETWRRLPGTIAYGAEMTKQGYAAMGAGLQAMGGPKYRVKETGEFVMDEEGSAGGQFGQIDPRTAVDRYKANGLTLAPVNAEDLRDFEYQQWGQGMDRSMEVEKARTAAYPEETVYKILSNAPAGVSDTVFGTDYLRALENRPAPPMESQAVGASILADPATYISLGAGAAKIGLSAAMKGATARSLNVIGKATQRFVNPAEVPLRAMDRFRKVVVSPAKVAGAYGAASGVAWAADQFELPSELKTAAFTAASLYTAYKGGLGVLRFAGKNLPEAAVILRESADATSGLDRAARQAVATNPNVPANIRERLLRPSQFVAMESTPARLAQNQQLSPGTRKLMDKLSNFYVVQGVRGASAVATGSVKGGLAMVPFAETMRMSGDERAADTMYGMGIALGALGGAGERVLGARGRRVAQAESDIGRMLTDIQAGNVQPGIKRYQWIDREVGRLLTDVELAAGDVTALLQNRSFDELARTAAMQGFFRNVDYIPLNAADFELNAKEHGGSGSAGYFIRANAGERPQIFVNVEARRADVEPHEYFEAFFSSDAFSPEQRAAMRAQVDQRYGADGLMARGREYAKALIKAENSKNFPNETLFISNEQIQLKMDELAQDELGRGGQDPMDWVRREVMVEEARMAGIDFAAIRRNVPAGENPITFMENVLGASARALGLSGVRIDPETGMAITPEQLFRENPVAANDPKLVKHLNDYVKAYRQWMNDPTHEVPQGVRIARDGRPESLADNPNVSFYSPKPEDPTVPRENALAIIGPDGRVTEKSPKQRRTERKARSSQVKNMAGRNLLAPGDPTFGLKRWADGRIRASGRRLPQTMALQVHWKPWLPIINAMEGLADANESMQVRYFAKGNSADKVKTSRVSDIDAINREVVFDQWTTNAAGDLLAQLLDMTTLRNRAMRAISERHPSLDPANGGPGYSLQAIMDDVTQWMSDKRAGKDGAATIGNDRKNIVNALINPGTAVNRGKNPLAGTFGKGSAIKTLLLENINAVSGTGRKGAAMDYNWANGNFMPDKPAPRPDMDSDVPAPRGIVNRQPARAQMMPDYSGRADIPLNERARRAAFVGSDGRVVSTNKRTHFETNEDLGPDFLAIGAGSISEDGFFRFGSDTMDNPMGETPSQSRAAAARHNREVYDSGRRPSELLEDPPGLEKMAARGQAMPDITITPDEARRQGLVGPVYHGSPDFKGRKFDPRYRARSSGLSRGGFSFTEDVASADSYAGAGVDSAQAAVDAANDVMRDLGARMEAGLKLREFADVSEVPEFNVRYADDMDELASYFNDLSKRIPKDLGARLRDAAKAINEPANPVVVEAYLRNPKEMMIDGKRLLVAENPDDIFVSAARPPQDAPSAAPRGQAMPDAIDEVTARKEGLVEVWHGKRNPPFDWTEPSLSSKTTHTPLGGAAEYLGVYWTVSKDNAKSFARPFDANPTIRVGTKDARPNQPYAVYGEDGGFIGRFETESRAREYSEFLQEGAKMPLLMRAFIRADKPKKFTSLTALNKQIREYYLSRFEDMSQFDPQLAAEIYAQHLREQGFDSITFKEGTRGAPSKNKADVFVSLTNEIRVPRQRRGQAMPDAQPRAQFMADSVDEPPRSLRDMPQSALKVLHADSDVLPKPTKKLTNATVALTLADIAEKHNGGIITSSNITPEQKADLKILGADEGEAALKASGKNAGNWYSVAIEAALGIAGVIYRELSDAVAARKHAVLAKEADPVKAGQFALRLPLAITSQNMTVKLNTRASNEQFNIFLKTGKFDPSIAYGEKAKSISGNLDLANVMIDELGSVLALEDFVSREFTVRELEVEASKIAGRKITIAGRKDDIVNGAAIFGPKIGQGFLQNLMGKFDPVTIDLWMRRTWGRWTGDVVGDGVTAQRLARLIDESRKVGRKLPDSIKRLRTTMRSMGETKTGKAKKPELTVSEDVELRLEEDSAFRKDVEAFAKQANAEFQALYRLMSDVMAPALAAKVQDAIARAERLPDQADSILSDTYNAVIREQSKVKKQLDKAWDALSLDKKKEMVAQRSPEFAKLKGKDKAQFIKKSKPILKGDWLEAQHQAAGRTALLDNPQKNAIKPAWANAAKSIVSELNPIDIPSDMDRRVITEVVNGIREELERRGYNVTNADVQAILWYPEKDLWAKLRGEEESILKQSYDDEFINIAEGLGLGREAREVAKQIRGY